MGCARRLARVVLLSGAVLVAPQIGRADAREASIGVGYRALRIDTHLDQSFRFQGVGLPLSYADGDPVGVWVQIEPWFPLWARGGGDAFAPRRAYDRAWGIDGWLLAAGRVELGPDTWMRAGAGVHFDGIRLSGGNYLDFNSLTFGLGTAVALRHVVGEPFWVGVTASLAVDFIDFAHAEDGLRWAVHGGLAANVGVRFE